MNAAAQELFVTHGAVSRQIRQLEQWLGCPLTEGPKTALKLTPDAIRLLQATTAAFDQIQASVPAKPKVEQNELNVACYGTFAIRWLIPRLPDFMARRPDIPIQVRETSGLIDFSVEDVDAAIQIRTAPDDPALELTPVIAHEYGPVLSARLWQSRREALDSAGLRRLHTRTWTQAWSDWAGSAGVDLKGAGAEQSFAHYSHMLEAAVAGLGVAMAPWVFVADDVLSGRLVAPLGFVRSSGWVEFARPKARKTMAGTAFRDWLLEQASYMPSAPPMPEDVNPDLRRMLEV
ncbi:MAG TPA: LysR family transcriptional regulator [Caulobacteraceae bacterium]|nr:LysR family transcriptional regulator [Caulobacteraceae bacterium]